MRNFKIMIMALASASATAGYAIDRDITSGSLESIIKEGVLNSETTLKLTGHIDARDLAAFEKLPPSIKTLDLSEVTIDGITLSTREYFGRTLFRSDEIPAYTFFKTGVETLTLPAGIAEIGEGAFAASAIRHLVVPEGVEHIGDFAFYGCDNLESVVLPSSLDQLGKGAFGNCRSLTEVDLSATGLKEIPERAFAGASELSSVVLPVNIEKIGREAFSQTSISQLNLSKVKNFEPYALSGMSMLENLTLNPNADIADGLLMDDTSLTSIAGAPEHIPDYFAANCIALDTQSAIAGAFTIGKYSFANNPATTLILTPGISTIDRGAISGMTALTRIDASALEGFLPEVDENTFEGIVQKEIVLYVNDEDYDTWDAHPIWRLFTLESELRTEVGAVTEDSEAISIKYQGGLLVIEGPDPIVDVKIFTTDGRLIMTSAPDTGHVEIGADNLPSGIAIVIANDANGRSGKASVIK